MYRSLVSAAIIVASLTLACAAGEPSYRMPQYAEADPPPPRDKAEVIDLVAGADHTPASDEPLKLLLVAGPKDHDVGEHDYPAWQKVWGQLLAKAPRTEVDTAWQFPSAEQLQAADVAVFYQKGDWNDERAAAIDAYLSSGGGLVYVHWAVNGNDRARDFAKRIGMASKAGAISYRHGPLTIDFSAAGDHPIARNFKRIRWYDEAYWRLRGDETGINLLGTSLEDGEATPQFWTYERDGGHVFVSVPGHYMWTFDDPAFRLLLMRGIAWAGGRNVDRFNELVLLDARVE